MIPTNLLNFKEEEPPTNKLTKKLSTPTRFFLNLKYF